MSQNDLIKCAGKCQLEKNKSHFYVSFSPLHNGKIPYCKTCIKKIVKPSDVETVKNTLRMIDKPYIASLWEASVQEKKKDVFGVYMKNLGMRQYRYLTWKDSNHETTNPIIEVSDGVVSTSPNSNDDLEKLKEKYGYGYPDNEYLLFEKKYQTLRPSFQLVTTMHEECLREYCVDKVKETLAKARGDFKEAKDWAAMAKDCAEAGKLKPSQMSKADLSQGLDGFGQLARMVEEKVDIISLLPKFVQQPKDKPDIVLWCYLNYIRDLKGLPEVEYKEIYKFYEERREDYEKQELDNALAARGEQ